MVLLNFSFPQCRISNYFEAIASQSPRNTPAPALPSRSYSLGCYTDSLSKNKFFARNRSAALQQKYDLDFICSFQGTLTSDEAEVCFRVPQLYGLMIRKLRLLITDQLLPRDSALRASSRHSLNAVHFCQIPAKKKINFLFACFAKSSRQFPSLLTWR